MNIPTDGYGLHRQIVPNLPVAGYGAWNLIYFDTTKGFVILIPELVSDVALSDTAVSVGSLLTLQTVDVSDWAVTVGLDDSTVGVGLDDATIGLSLADTTATVGIGDTAATVSVDDDTHDVTIGDDTDGVSISDDADGVGLDDN